MAHIANEVSNLNRRSAARSGEFRVSKFIAENFEFLNSEENVESYNVSNDPSHEEDAEKTIPREESQPVAMEIDSEDNRDPTEHSGSTCANEMEGLAESRTSNIANGQTEEKNILDQALEKLRVTDGVNGLQNSGFLLRRQTSSSPNSSPKLNHRYSLPCSLRSPVRLARGKSATREMKSVGKEMDSASPSNSSHRRNVGLRHLRNRESLGSRSTGSESLKSRGSEDSEEDDDDDAG